MLHIVNDKIPDMKFPGGLSTLRLA